LPPPLTRVVAFFETISPEQLSQIDTLYAPDCRFKDPFNEVQGTRAIHGIFAAMFRQVRSPRFFVRQWLMDETQAFLTWDFEFQLGRGRGGQLLRIHGASRLVFDEQGRIVLHRDYWDAAEELYEKLPLLGVLMRWLKKRAAH
jgi:hypothetical protein